MYLCTGICFCFKNIVFNQHDQTILKVVRDGWICTAQYNIVWASKWKLIVVWGLEVRPGGTLHRVAWSLSRGVCRANASLLWIRKSRAHLHTLQYCTLIFRKLYNIQVARKHKGQKIMYLNFDLFLLIIYRDNIPALLADETSTILSVTALESYVYCNLYVLLVEKIRVYMYSKYCTVQINTVRTRTSTEQDTCTVQYITVPPVTRNPSHTGCARVPFCSRWRISSVSTMMLSRGFFTTAKVAPIAMHSTDAMLHEAMSTATTRKQWWRPRSQPARQVPGVSGGDGGADSIPFDISIGFIL